MDYKLKYQHFFRSNKDLEVILETKIVTDTTSLLFLFREILHLGYPK